MGEVDIKDGKITLKHGEDTEVYDLSKPEDLQKLGTRAQVGWNYDKEIHSELGDLRKRVAAYDNMEALFEQAKTSDEAMENFVKLLEAKIGRPITKAEQKQLDAGNAPKILEDELENEKLTAALQPLMKTNQELMEEIKAIKKAQQEREVLDYAKELEREAKALAKKYNGEDGYPKFDPDAVFAYQAKTGIESLELAYKTLNHAKIVEAETKKAIEEQKKLIGKRQDAQSISTSGEPALEVETKPKAKSYNALAAEVLSEMKKKGISLTTED